MDDEGIAPNTYSWSSQQGQKVAPVHYVFFVPNEWMNAESKHMYT